MRSSNWLIVIGAAALMAGGLITSNSKGAERGPAGHTGWPKWLEAAREKLGLTQEQEDKIKAALREDKGTLKELISARQNARTGLRNAIQAPDANENSVRSAAAKVAAVEADLAVERMKLYGRISPILSSEQMQKLKELRAGIDEAMERASERMAKGLDSQ